MKVVGAVLMYLGPVTVASGASPGPAARAVVAAAAVDTGAAMASALRAAATRTRRARLVFLANMSNSNRFLGMYRYDPGTGVDGSVSGTQSARWSERACPTAMCEPFRPLPGSKDRWAS